MKRILLSLFCLCLPAGLRAQEPAPIVPGVAKALVPEPRAEAGCKARHARFNEISKAGTAEVVFLGDSITEGWEGAGKAQWEKSWAPLKAANFGIGGDRTENVLWRLDNGNYDGLKAKVTVLMIGTNNTGHRMDPAGETAAGVKAIVERLRAKQPQMKILVLGVFPRGEKADDPARVRTGEINQLISKLADNQSVYYMDLSSTFLPAGSGVLSREIMPDFLHLSPKGYELWAAAIDPKVKELLAK